MSQSKLVARYCVPTDDDRPLLDAKRQFFEISTGKVPVIVIFTKIDGLEIKANNHLRYSAGRSRRQAKEEQTALAEEWLQEHFLGRLKTVSNKPAACVRLRDLHRPEGHVKDLVKHTAEVLDNLPLQKLFVLAKGYDLETRTKYGVKDLLQWYLETTELFGRTSRGIRLVLVWLTHVWTGENEDNYYNYAVRDAYFHHARIVSLSNP